MTESWDPLEPPVAPEPEISLEVSSDDTLDALTEPDVLADDPAGDVDPEPIDLDADTDLPSDAEPDPDVTSEAGDPDAGIDLAPDPELDDELLDDDPADGATIAPIDLTDGDDAPDDGTIVPELAPIDLTGDDADAGDAAVIDPMTPIDLADPDDGGTAPAADPMAADMTLADHLGARMIEGEPVEWTLESVCGSQAEAFAVVVAEPPRDAAEPAADDRDDGPGPRSRDRVVAHDAVDGLDSEELVAEAIRTASADAVERPDKLGTLTDRVAEPHGDAPKPLTPAQDPGPVVTMVMVTHVDPTAQTVTLDVDGELVTLDFADIRSVLDSEPTAYRVDRRDVATDVAVGIGSAGLTLAPLALGRLIQRRRRGAAGRA